MQVILIIIVFLFGISIGSFANVCIYRLPRKKSIANPPRSFCPRCGKTIAWYDNIPILGFLLLRGKCRYCCASISVQYPLVELLIGLLFVGVYLFIISRGGQLILIPFYWYFCTTLVILSVIDGEFFILPDWLTYPLVIVGFLLADVTYAHHESVELVFVEYELCEDDIVDAGFDRLTGLPEGEGSSVLQQ